MRRWERTLDGGLPSDPSERVAYLLAVTPPAPDHARAALLMVVVHASSALRYRHAALDALADRDAPDRSLRVIGEASMAAVSLFLAARAAQRYCEEEEDESGPLGRRRLGELVATTEHLRDCVMHWDDKARATSPAFLNVTEHDVLVLGSDRRRQSAIAGLTWRRFESDADRLRRWAEYKLEAGEGPGE